MTKRTSIEPVENHAPTKHLGLRRHHAHAHHWSASAILGAAVVALIVLLVATIGHQNDSPAYHAPAGTIASEARTTLGGVNADMTQVDAGALPTNIAGQ